MTVTDFSKRRFFELSMPPNKGLKVVAHLLCSVNLLLRSGYPNSSLKCMPSAIVRIAHSPSGVVPRSARLRPMNLRHDNQAKRRAGLTQRHKFASHTCKYALTATQALLLLTLHRVSTVSQLVSQAR